MSEDHQIVVPVIQRDYAQGRTNEKVSSIRAKFLNSIGNALISQEPLSLDFIYGAEAGSQIELIDGQQRFTTLFLLHWYLAGKSNANEECFNQLSKFTYCARTSSKEFCGKLCEKQSEIFEKTNKVIEKPFSTVIYHEIRFDNSSSISKLLEKKDKEFVDRINEYKSSTEIVDEKDLHKNSLKFLKDLLNKVIDEGGSSSEIQKELNILKDNKKNIYNSWKNCIKTPFSFVIRDAKWFLREWEKDPTVTSLLTMLDAIANHDEINRDPKKAWEQLTSDDSPITFEFLSVKEFGNSEDLYVKMNSRGKPLTSFENFKAMFGKHLEDLDNQKLMNEYWSNIDGNWSATFWEFIKERYSIREIPENEYYFSIDDTILKYIWLQVEMYSVYINKNRDSQPDFYENGKPKLVFEHIDNPKNHQEDWQHKFVKDRSPEELLIRSLQNAGQILKLIKELLNKENGGINVWDKSSTIDRLFALEKWRGDKPQLVDGTGSDDYNIRILSFIIIYWCSAFECPENEKKERLKGYLRAIRNSLQRYRSKKARHWNSELDNKNYGKVLAFILDNLLDQNIDCSKALEKLSAEQLRENSYFASESKKYNRYINYYNDSQREECYQLEESDILKGTILPLLRDNGAIIGSQEFADWFNKDSIILTAKALLAISDDEKFFAIPSGESNNNRNRIAFCDTDLRSWSVALQYDRENFSETNTIILEKLVKSFRDGNRFEDLVKNYITRCESEKYTWRYYLLKYWEYVFATRSVYISERLLPEWPTFELPEDRFACRTSYTSLRFSDDNTCNVLIIMAATKWCKDHNYSVSSVFKGGKEAVLSLDEKSVSLKYDDENKRFIIKSGSNISEIQTNINTNIVEEISNNITF